ncbi:MAG: hypothetical protein RIQ72_481 [Candidatus Parcubacteria bacterium]|jgi:hypothetical protein
MLHLLPQYQKDKVIKEYRLRLAVVIIGTLLFLTLVFIILTLPTYMVLQNQKGILISQKDSLSQLINVGGSASKDNNLDIWKAVDALLPVAGGFVPSAYIDAVTPKQAGVTIDGYAFVQGVPGQPVSVSINGTAKTREGLTEYVKVLNAKFGGVKLPLASLAKQADIPFDFKFQIDDTKIYE